MHATILRTPATQATASQRSISSVRHTTVSLPAGVLPRASSRGTLRISNGGFYTAGPTRHASRMRACNPRFSYSGQQYGGQQWRPMLKDFFDMMQKQFDAAEGTSTGMEDRELPFPVDTTEDGKNYYLYADLPGVEKTDLKITTRDQSVTIRANRPRPFTATTQNASTQTTEPTTETTAEASGATEESASTTPAAEEQRPRRRERFYGKFARTLTFPEDADMSKVTAKVTAGVLQLTIAKKELEQPKWQEVPVM